MAEDFNEIQKAISLKLQDTTDDYEKAHFMRLDALTSYNQIVSKSESAAVDALEEHLQSYIPLVCGPTMNNYAGEVQRLLQLSDIKSPPVWKSLLCIEDIDKLLPVSHSKEQYEDFKYQEITDDDVKGLNLFKKQVQFDKNIHSNISTNEHKRENKFNLVLNERTSPSIPNDPELFSQNLTRYQENLSNEKRSYNYKEFSNDTPKSFDFCSENLAQNFSKKEERPSNVESVKPPQEFFRTAADELYIQNLKKNMANTHQPQKTLFDYGMSKKSLGARRGIRGKFVPPVKKIIDEMEEFEPQTKEDNVPVPESTDERLKNVDAKMIEMIKNEIMHKVEPINWDDIAGLEYAKSIIQEAVVWPLLRPDIFTGLRRPPKGVLLFGPPGTGKTLIGKCIASQSESTFFSISASSLTSKWIGEGEKMVRALFAVATVHQPSVVFIDEIDSLLCQRSESEHESSRRIKTEFLVQLDGARTLENERILVVGATNRPQELDEAARRRFVRRLYIPLPEFEARRKMLKHLLSSVHHELSDEDINKLSKLTDGYSGADMGTLCTEASMEPIRSIPRNQILSFDTNQLRPVQFRDLEVALERVRASVSRDDLNLYIDWNKTYGSGNVS